MQATSSRGRGVWAIGCALVACGLLYALRGVLTPVLFAFLLAYLLDPVVDRLELLKVPRAGAIVVLLAVAFLVLGLLVLLVVPAVMSDLAVLASELPAALQRGLTQAGPWLAQRGIVVPSTGHDALEAIQNQLRGLSPGAFASIQTFAALLLGGTASALSGAAALVLVPILAFYLLLDFDILMAAAAVLIPERYRATTLELVREVDVMLGQFVRGQLLVMCMLAVIYAVGYSLVGVRLAVPIGLVAGLLAFIPYLGGGVALGLGILMSALHYQGIGQLVAVVVVYAIVQFLEGFVITPRIVGDKLGLSALVVLVALMVGGELFGFLGVMLALPLAAVVKVFATHGIARYRASALFLGRASIEAYGSSHAGEAYGSSHAGEAYGSSHAGEARGSSRARESGLSTPRGRMRLRSRPHARLLKRQRARTP